MEAKHTPMVVAAAKKLCKRESEQYNIDFDDNWKLFGNNFLEDAQAVLDAVGAPDLLAALQSVMEWTAEDNIPADRKLALIRNAARAAIDKANATS